MTEETQIDWFPIEADYRAGLLSLRQIGTKHDVNHIKIVRKAKLEGWTRDLTARIRARAEELVTKRAVTADEAKQRSVTAAEVVEVSARNQADLIIEHRILLPRFKKLVTALLSELELQTKDPVMFEELGVLLHAPDEKGVDKLNAIYQKVISTPGRTSAVKQLAETLKILIGLERQAFGLADNGNGEADKPPAPPVSNEEAARRVAFLLLTATKGKQNA